MEPIKNLVPETVPALPPVPPPSGVHRVFIGPDGLRAGWRFLIYFAAFVALAFAFSRATRPFVPHGKGLPPLWVFLLGECEQFAAAVIPALVLCRFEKRPFGAYGFPRQGAFGENFWSGIVWGIVAISVLLASLRGIGVFYFGGIVLHGLLVLKYAAYWAVLFLAVGFFEEFVTRGYTQFTLAKGIGFWPAALLLSAAFGAIHLGNQGEAVVGALGAAVHASWDWGETFFYSVPDSGIVFPGHLMNPSFHGSRWLTGGSVGPEGSVLLFVLIAAMWVLFDRMYPPKRAAEN